MVIHVIALKNYVVRLGNREITPKNCFICAESLVVKSVDDIKICVIYFYMKKIKHSRLSTAGVINCILHT